MQAEVVFCVHVLSIHKFYLFRAAALGLMQSDHLEAITSLLHTYS